MRKLRIPEYGNYHSRKFLFNCISYPALSCSGNDVLMQKFCTISSALPELDLYGSVRWLLLLQSLTDGSDLSSSLCSYYMYKKMYI